MTDLDALAGRYEEAQRVADDAQLAEVCVEYIDALRAEIVALKAVNDDEDHPKVITPTSRLQAEYDALLAMYDDKAADIATLTAHLRTSGLLAARLTEERDIAEKVCEAAELIGRRACYVIPDRMALTAAQWKAMECGECAACQFNNALTDWRRTKDANTGHSTQV